MASEFSTEFFSANRIVKADLRAARTPREEDLERIKKEVAKLYDATEVILNVTVDDSLLSGYVLQIGDRVFDNSGRHAIDQMMADKPSLATLKTRVEDYKPAATSEEGGVVISSADGIVEVEGMDRAVYGEIVTFENGAKGMVESVEPGRLGIMLFDGAETVGVGTMVTRRHPGGRRLPWPRHRPAGRAHRRQRPHRGCGLQPHREAGPRHPRAPERGHAAPHRHPRHRLHVPHWPRPA